MTQRPPAPVIGIDIGGTKLAGAVVGPDARLRARLEQPSCAPQGLEASLAQIFQMIAGLLQTSGPTAGIGVCAPGPLHPGTGVIFNPPNMPGWINVRLAEEIERRFHLPCRVENDANGAGLAEAIWGAGRHHSRVFYATISTGIGTGIIFDRRVYHGKNGAAGEGGHMSIDFRSSVVCNCGNPGCIEALASGTAIARRARELLDCGPEPITAEIVAQKARSGHTGASRLIEETGEMLGAWLGSILSLLDPDIIILGGGVTRIGKPLFRKIRETAPRRTINPFAAETPIVPAALEADVGILGAAAVMLSA